MAERRAALTGVQLDLFPGDIIDFDLAGAPLDAAIFMYETFPVITTQPTMDEWRLRVYSPWDLQVLLKTIAGWQLDGFYTWNNLSQTITDEEHYFMVLEAT